MLVCFLKDTKSNYENTKTKNTKYHYGLFGISTFRDFVIKDLFLKKQKSMLHANRSVGSGYSASRLNNPAKPAFPFLEISQYGHEFFA